MIHVHFTVPESEQKRYESWLIRLLLAAQQTEGFIASQVIRPNSDNASYHVLASFSSFNAQSWKRIAAIVKFLSKNQNHTPTNRLKSPIIRINYSGLKQIAIQVILNSSNGECQHYYLS